MGKPRCGRGSMGTASRVAEEEAERSDGWEMRLTVSEVGEEAGGERCPNGMASPYMGPRWSPVTVAVWLSVVAVTLGRVPPLEGSGAEWRPQERSRRVGAVHQGC